MSTETKRKGWFGMSPGHRKNFLVTFSAFKLRMFERCPLEFYYNYIEPEETVIFAPNLFGISVHRMLQFFFERGYESKETFLRFWWIYWWKVVLHQNRLRGIRFLDEDQEEEEKKYYKIGVKILSSFWGENIVLRGTDLSPEVEKRFSFSFGRFTLIGSIDRRQPVRKPEEGIEIIDYKTGLKYFKEPEMRRDYQFTVYQLAEEILTGKSPVAMYVDRLNLGERISVALRTDEDYELLYRVLESTYVTLTKLLTTTPKPADKELLLRNPEYASVKTFMPRPSSYCNICPHEGRCFASRATRLGDEDVTEALVELGKASTHSDATQLELALPYKFKKYREGVDKKDTPTSKHKRKVSKGKGQLSWDLD